jgi:hypothetical protein
MPSTLKRRRKQLRAKTFKLPVRELAQQYDVLFIGLDGGAFGEVIAKAGPAGQRAIEKLFPNGRIAWRESRSCARGAIKLAISQSRISCGQRHDLKAIARPLA